MLQGLGGGGGGGGGGSEQGGSGGAGSEGVRPAPSWEAEMMLSASDNVISGVGGGGGGGDWSHQAAAGPSRFAMGGGGDVAMDDDLLGDLDSSAWELPEFEPPPDFS
jgi:hypothetical protein